MSGEIVAYNECKWCEIAIELHVIKGQPTNISPNGLRMEIWWHAGGGVYCNPDDVERNGHVAEPKYPVK